MNAFITLLVVLFLGCRVSAIPYTPSHLLYSAQYNGSIAYLLRPSDSNTTEFLSLNISKDIDSANPQYTSLLDDAPFQLYKQNLALIPAIDQHGILKVYAGDCHNTSGYGALWQFTPDAASSTGNGTWERIEVNGTGQSNVSPHGPNYLAAGFTYASTNTTNSSFYVFGGMCPLASASEATWITAANYSQSMIALEPPKTDSLTSYRISATGDRAPPIPEAGFTITPLQATYRSTSSGTLLQQQDFLMIGGQTQNAFINMSQVAVFSLPQSSWSFVTIDSTLSLSRTELAIRDPLVVEPRSGHTAVLSPDGSKVVVFGGWVGSTSVPANPQLAILELAADSIGSAEWAWKIPPTGDAGMAEGTGIYGHGATMLPGGVMMITGGYHISQSSKRSITGTEVNSKTLMYNVTSGKWVSSYSNPGPSPDGGSGSSVSRRAGLGIGLGLGIPFVAGAAAVFLWFYFRRRRPPLQCNNEYMRSDGTGDMHPIDEEDEAHGAAGGDSTICRAAHHSSTVLLPKTAHTEPSPEGVKAFATSIGRANERQSSEHDDRTSSNLSGSSRSAAQQSRGIMDNHPSQPSSGRESPEKSSSASNRSRDTWSRPNSTLISHERRSSDSFSTAHTTISQRQAEGEYLLRNDPEPSSPIDLIPRPLSISKPRAEWIGNVRRVLSMTRKRPQSSEDGSVASAASGIDRRSAVLGPAGSLLDYKTESKLPRRSVSASAELFRRKQGAKDWGAGNIVSRELTGRMTRDDFGLDGVLDLDDDDWDVEGAAENRRVQVTFTVPKEKLRVVNATANDMDNISEASISRSDSRT
ncbi:hypothetical protein APSETT444_004638 [Aspergillus pseudonomiae]